MEDKMASFDGLRCKPLLACALATGLMAPAGALAWTKYTPSGDAKREDVPKEYRWSLEHLFGSYEEWEQLFTQLEGQLPELEPCRGTLAQGAQQIKKCLDLSFGLKQELYRLAVFADADYSTDRTLSAAKVRSDRVQALFTRFSEASSFIQPELLAIEPDVLRSYIKAEPGLEPYAHTLEDLIRRRAHILSPDQERILALTGDLAATPYSIHAAIEEDVKFPPVIDENGKEIALTMASFPGFRDSQNREFRKQAVDKFFGTLRAYARSFAASLDAAVKANIMYAKARGYESALEASVDANAVPPVVYKTLVEATRANLPKTLHRYVKLRQKLMGIDEVHYYDLYTALFPKASMDMPYPEATKVVLESLKPLGKDYIKMVEVGLDPKNGWVDVYPNKGKRSGAYCNSSYRRHPIVFLNHLDRLEDVFTLTHEFGHALHFHLANQAQAFPNADAPIFLAEIASTFNETLLLDHLLKKAKTKEQRLALLNKRVESIRTTVFRQVMFAEFEAAIHAEVEGGGALTADRLAEIYEGLVRTYYGPDFKVGADDGYEWAYIPHFYYNFYVYQYATGLMSAIALAKNVTSGDKKATKRYLDFLAEGGSDWPIDSLKRAGVDLTTAEAMQATFDLFAKTLDEIEALLAK
jgi:oligoendopeptidase F